MHEETELVCVFVLLLRYLYSTSLLYSWYFSWVFHFFVWNTFVDFQRRLGGKLPMSFVWTELNGFISFTLIVDVL